MRLGGLPLLPWHEHCVGCPTMLREPCFWLDRALSIGSLHRLTLLLVTSTTLSCGKTPEGTVSASGGSGGALTTTGGAGTTSSGGSSAGPSDSGHDTPPPFACATAAQPGKMASVPASAFPMGCAATDASCEDDEKPLHTVSLAAFEIDLTEVTQAEYTSCIQAKACEAPSCAWDCGQPTYPAACITRNEAEAYCAWAGKRLPTEAEWEKAARGTDGRIYPWGNEPPDCARVNEAGCSGHLDPVGTHPTGASPYGALDLEGNVVEMVADWYDAHFYATSPSTDPSGPATGTRYVGRGGGYKSDPVWQRASARDWYDLTDASASLGFRCAR
jgi:formylglycine-generating enzyme required for sulfatase activity